MKQEITNILNRNYGVSVFHDGERTLFSIPAQALKRTLCGDSSEFETISLLMRMIERTERKADHV